MSFAAKQAAQFKKPLYITEWSSDPGSRSPYHDTTDTAAYIVGSIADIRHLGLTTYSYWTFSGTPRLHAVTSFQYSRLLILQTIRRVRGGRHPWEKHALPRWFRHD